MTGILRGSVAIVTGAGQGVGKGIALALAREDCAVLVTGRTESKLAAVCAEIGMFGGSSYAVTMDVCSPDDIERTVNAALAQFGGIDILVNNAQIVENGPLADLTDTQWNSSMDSGPLATVRLMRAVRPHMIARGGGSVINMSSGTTVSRDNSGWGFYSAAKLAIEGVSRNAAVEWGPDNIRVNTVAPIANSPGMIDRQKHHPEEFRGYVESIPLRRIGDLESDIGRVAVFLASRDSKYVTGVVLPVDGGMWNFN